MDFNDIETMLREKRATPEEIAKAFTDQLNAAIAATAEPTEWEKGLADLVDDWNYMIDLYVENHKDETKGWESTDIYMTHEAMEEMLMAAIDGYKMADTIVADVNKWVKDIEKYHTNEDIDFKRAMQKFFKEIGL